MPRRRRPGTLEGIAVDMIDYYDMRSSNPHLGSDATLPLAVGENNSVLDAPPTIRNLVWHFGLCKKLTNRIRINFLKGIPLDLEETKALEWYQKEKIFKERHVIPLRKYLDTNDVRRFWFYCIPAGGPFKKDQKTGELKQGMSDIMPLTLLPKEANRAMDSYSLSEARMHVLAQEVGWLIIKMCQRRRFRLQKDAYDALADWIDFMPKEPLSMVQDKIAFALPPITGSMQ
jgi:hypothetical protein